MPVPKPPSAPLKKPVPRPDRKRILQDLGLFLARYLAIAALLFLLIYLKHRGTGPG